MPSVSLLSLFSLSVCLSHTDEVRAAVGGDEGLQEGTSVQKGGDRARWTVSFQEINENGTIMLHRVGMTYYNTTRCLK